MYIIHTHTYELYLHKFTKHFEYDAQILTYTHVCCDKERDFADQRNVTMATAGASGLSAASDLEMSYPIESVPSPGSSENIWTKRWKVKESWVVDYKRLVEWVSTPVCTIQQYQ